MDVSEQLEPVVGAHAVTNGERARQYAVGDLNPACVVSPATVDELRGCVAAIDAADAALIPLGNGSRLAVGRAPRRYDVALSTRRLQRVLAHEAADMTVTVEAGMTLAELNAFLARAGQRLPLDPPHPERTTIGGLIATDASGPLRLSQGKVRDLLIGIKVVLADGTLVKGGGRVVKNVAGYDLMKLFTGSYGTLGIIVEATFKVRPRPEFEVPFVVLTLDLSDAANLAQAILATTGLAPKYLVLANRQAAERVQLGTFAFPGMRRQIEHIQGPALIVGAGDGGDEVGEQWNRFQAITGERTIWMPRDGQPLYAALRDLPAHRDAGVLGCRVSLLPSRLGATLTAIHHKGEQHGFSVEMVAHAGNGVASIRFDGARSALVALAQSVNGTVRAAGGYVVFESVPTTLKAHIDPWGADIPGIELMRGIKRTLDPRDRLSPGRFVGGI